VTVPIIIATVLILGTITVLRAEAGPVPEIDPTSGMAALALIAGTVGDSGDGTPKEYCV
jgi:hypothetical protein